MNAGHRNRNNKRQGAALVEAAVVMPILILVTFGAIKYGWLIYRLQQVTNVTRQAARLAIRPSATDAEVVAAVDAWMGRAGLTKDLYTTEIQNLGASPGSAITVSITVPTDSTKIDLVQTRGLLPKPKDLSVSVTMSKEGPQ